MKEIRKQIEVNIYWKNIKGTYIDSETIFVGKVPVACYFYDGVSSKEQKNRMKAISKVSGIKEHLGNYATDKECIDVCEKAVEKYLELLQFALSESEVQK